MRNVKIQLKKHSRTTYKEIPWRRVEDQNLLERWVSVRSGQIADAKLDIFQVSERYARMRSYWNDSYSGHVRSYVRRFANFIDCPLAIVGLIDQPEGRLDRDILRASVRAYAQHYEQITIERLQRDRPELLTRYDSGRGPIAFRLAAWTKFLKIIVDFFDWLEMESIRPPGTNPFRGLRNFSILPHVRGRITIVQEWYNKILDYAATEMSARDAAVIMLMANSLRLSEVLRLTVRHVFLERRVVLVELKNRVRIVPLYTRTLNPLTALLAQRRTAELRVFPYVPRTVLNIIQRAIKGAGLSTIADAHITPHRFRHFFASEAMANGMRPSIVLSPAPLMARWMMLRTVRGT